jgi:hypothetical protein
MCENSDYLCPLFKIKNENKNNWEIEIKPYFTKTDRIFIYVGFGIVLLLIAVAIFVAIYKYNRVTSCGSRNIGVVVYESKNTSGIQLFRMGKKLQKRETNGNIEYFSISKMAPRDINNRIRFASNYLYYATNIKLKGS